MSSKNRQQNHKRLKEDVIEDIDLHHKNNSSSGSNNTPSSPLKEKGGLKPKQATAQQYSQNIQNNNNDNEDDIEDQNIKNSNNNNVIVENNISNNLQRQISSENPNNQSGQQIMLSTLNNIKQHSPVNILDMSNHSGGDFSPQIDHKNHQQKKFQNYNQDNKKSNDDITPQGQTISGSLNRFHTDAGNHATNENQHSMILPIQSHKKKSSVINPNTLVDQTISYHVKSKVWFYITISLLILIVTLLILSWIFPNKKKNALWSISSFLSIIDLTFWCLGTYNGKKAIDLFNYTYLKKSVLCIKWSVVPQIVGCILGELFMLYANKRTPALFMVGIFFLFFFNIVFLYYKVIYLGKAGLDLYDLIQAYDLEQSKLPDGKKLQDLMSHELKPAQKTSM